MRSYDTSMTHRDALSGACDELLLHADCLHVLTLAPRDALPVSRMLELLAHQLTALQERVIARLSSEEHRNYLTTVIAVRPDLAEHLRELTRQRGKLKTKLARLVGQVARARGVTALAGDFTELIELLDAHGSAERELIACLADAPNGDQSKPDASRVRVLAQAYTTTPAVGRTG